MAQKKKSSGTGATKTLVDYHKAMQDTVKKQEKERDIRAIGLEAPTGTNGAISTNVLCVDLITGGGFPRQRFTTVSGDSGAGKTSLIQASMGPQLEQGVVVHYKDLEGAADHAWMRKNGTDMNKYLGAKGKPKTLYYIPDFNSGDDAFRYSANILDAAIKFVESGFKSENHLNIIYHDSLPASVSEDLLEDMDQGSKPFLAALLSRYLPIIRIKLKKANSAYIAVNQLRENPRARLGNPEYEPGGNSPTFYADMKLWLSCESTPKDLDMESKHPIVPTDSKYFKAMGINIEENPDGSQDQYRYTRIKTVKNRVFSPQKTTFMRIWIADQSGIGQGIDPVFDTLRFYEEIGMCDFYAKNEVMLAKKPGDKKEKYDYFDLKAEILTHPDLRDQAKELLQSGKAFEMYFSRLAGRGVEIVDADAEIPEDAAPPIGKDAVE